MTQPNQSADATKPPAPDAEYEKRMRTYLAANGVPPSTIEAAVAIARREGQAEEAMPKLPEARIVSYQVDGTMRRTELRTYDDADMHAYLRADRADRRPSEAPATLRVVQPQQEEWLAKAMELVDALESEVGNDYAPSERATNEAREALRSHLSMRLQAVPPGWQMVPIEPTVEMRLALARFEDLESPDRAWRAALAAAPTPKEK